MRPSLPRAEESARLDELSSYDILGSLPEAEFDTLAVLAADTCAAPMSALVLVGERVAHLKARVGLAFDQVARERWFDELRGDDGDLILVNDTRARPEMAGHPLVVGYPRTRFYASARLRTRSGLALGTLTVMDIRPRSLPPSACRTLRRLADQAVLQLERRRALRRAVHLSAHAQALLGAVTETLFDVGSGGHISYVSDGWTRLTGFAIDASLGLEFESCFAAEDRSKIRALLQDAAAGTPRACDSRLMQLDGKARWVEVSTIEPRAGYGPRGITGRIIDIERARRAEVQHETHVRELRRQETLMERTQAVARIGGWELDPATRTLAWTSESYRIHGIAPHGPVPGLDATLQAYGADSRRALHDALQAAQADGSAFDVELELKLPGGQRRWVRHTGYRDDRAIGDQRLVGTVQDVTERRQLEIAVLSAAQAERESIAFELHDGLAQELAGVSIMLRALTARVGAVDQTAAAELDEVTGLVVASLDTCRALAHGIAPVSPTRGGLRAALERLCLRTAQMRQIEISCDAHLDAPELLNELVADDLFLIAQESISNAARHGRARRVAVHLEVHAAGGVLSIVDDGIGVDFEATGAGMGLRIMRHRARRIGAQLDIERRPEGGTAVTCRFSRTTFLPHARPADA